MVSTRAKDQPSPGRLQFKEKLTGTHTNDALLKKLKALHQELAPLDQEIVERETLSSVRKQLIHKGLLLHKDRGVKAYVACCIADLLRLYAPDAPYDQDELRDIFQFFFKQLSTGLQGTSAPYYELYFALLESLSTVKSVVLVCDLPSSDDLMAEIFKTMFSLVRRNLAKKVEMFMADILVALIDESQSVSQGVLDVLLSQFTAKELGHDQPGYRLAIQVCATTSDKLQRPIAQFFSDTIVTSHDAEDEKSDADVQTAHDLLPRLLAASTDIVASVMPQLDEELKTEDLTIRSIATVTLGAMYRDIKHGPELAQKHPTTWSNWIGRRNDREREVRLAFIEGAKGLIGMGKLPTYTGPGASADTDGADPIEASLNLKMLDPDEKVRAAACKVYGTLDYEIVLHHVGVPTLQTLLGRTVDKKANVRAESLKSVGTIYSLAYPEIEAGTTLALEHFAWIPNELISNSNLSNEVKLGVEQTLFTYMFPLPNIDSVDEVAWTDRLLNIMKYMDGKSQKSLFNMGNLRTTHPSLYHHFLDNCVKYRGGTGDEDVAAVTQRLSQIIKRISMQFPDPQKAAEDFHAFAKDNDGRLYKLLKACMDVNSDLKATAKSVKEFTKRLPEAIAPTILVALRRSTLWLVNKSSIPTLLRRVQGISSWSDGAATGFTQTQTQSQSQPESQDTRNGTRRQSTAQRSHTRLAANNAVLILRTLSKHCPELFKDHANELLRGAGASGHTQDEDADGSDDLDFGFGGGELDPDADEEMVDVAKEACLGAFSSLLRYDPSLTTGVNDSNTLRRMMKLALGGHCRQAKFASRIIASSGDKEERCVDLVEDIVGKLKSAEPDHLAAHMSALVQLARYAPDALEHKSKEIIDFLIKKLLLVSSFNQQMDVDEDEDEADWVDDDELDGLTIAKVQALKVCRYRCLAHSTASTARDIAKPVLKLFFNILNSQGNIIDGGRGREDPAVMSRLRLEAATSLMHLSGVESLGRDILPNFVHIALTVQDPCYNVRLAFLSKLVTLLARKKLPVQYNIVPFLTVHDPEEDVKTMAASYVHAAFRGSPPSMRVDAFEMVFIRFLHLLAHHPDFKNGPGALVDISKHIDFYLDLVANQDSVSLIYHLAMRAKTVEDPSGQEYSNNLYMVSELSQELIKKKAASHSWNIPTYPGKVKLPPDILKGFDKAEVANKVAKTIYLPEEVLAMIEESEKEKTNKERKEKRLASTAKRKARTATNGNVKRNRRKKRRRTGDDDDDNVYTSDAPTNHDHSEDEQHGGASTDGGEENGGEESQEGSEGEEQLGRGARSKAKAKLQRKTKKTNKRTSTSRRTTSPLTSASELE